MQGDDYRYWAFVSYSHRDRAWGEWLQKSIETWRVPRRLVGRTGPAGPTPRRLFPVFRDRDELPSSPDLSGAIGTALEQSRFLIVIASPYAAVSRWVDQEIERFRALGRADRILCLIVDGEPNAQGPGQLECLPPALREGQEPIGADVRPGQDGRTLARTKLLAGLLGIGLDELRRRERRRRRLRVALGAAGLVALAGAAGGLVQVMHRQAADELAEQARIARVDQLYESGRREMLSHREARAAVLLAEAYRMGRQTPALRVMLARAMRVVESERQRIQTGAPLKSAAFSPDGRRIASIGTDGSTAIWDVASGARQSTLTLTAPALSVGRFSDDGSRYAVYVGGDDGTEAAIEVFDTASGQRLAKVAVARQAARGHTLFGCGGRCFVYVAPDGAARVWNIDEGREPLRLVGHYAVASFGRDGRQIVTGDAEGQVLAWDAQTGRKLRAFSKLDSRVVYLDTSPDGRLLAASAAGGRIRLWETDTGAVRLSAAHAGRMIGHVFNWQDGARLLTASVDSARVWDTRSGALLYAFKFANNRERVHISEDGRRLVNTGSDRLEVLDIDTGTALYTLDAQDGGVADIDFSRDDRLLTAGRDGSIALWQLPALPLAETAHGTANLEPLDPVGYPLKSTAAWSADGRGFATGGADGIVEVRDAATLASRWQWRADAAAVTGLAFDPAGKRLAVATLGHVTVHDAQDGRVLRRYEGLDKPVRLLRWSPGADYLLAVQRGRMSQLWRVDDGETVLRWTGDNTAAVAFAPDGRHLATAEKGQIALRRLEDAAVVWSHPAVEPADKTTTLDFSADSRRLLRVSDEGRVELLDAATGNAAVPAGRIDAEDVKVVAFDHAARLAVIGDANRCATLIAPNLVPQRRLCDHGAAVSAVQFLGDGGLVVTASLDGTARLWDTASGAPLGVVGFHNGEIDYRGALASPDGTRLLTVGNDGRARLWSLDLESRDPAVLERLLACRVPWRLSGTELVAQATHQDACATPPD